MKRRFKLRHRPHPPGTTDGEKTLTPDPQQAHRQKETIGKDGTSPATRVAPETTTIAGDKTFKNAATAVSTTISSTAATPKGAMNGRTKKEQTWPRE
ncbi:hypothetical protein DAPPUDRAFT_336150 [Daphnia pulex]|uniref:Uncharacterized protein n=1 Tax=Daphnia pulex TaxID=6669 RepID=E9HZ72_DAPPU|nr:hypothetical protein DAPPUDRAFT_336150 [Daphnia pulex]|eukprot:EFX62958.1 hypothetical protein DAPPUDRAFT_336150 [Daphnia pulex]